MKVSWKPIRKILASILAAAVTAGPIALGDAFGWHIDQALAVLIVGIVTPLTGYLTPGEDPVPGTPPVVSPIVPPAQPMP